jgi:hypothetical protein
MKEDTGESLKWRHLHAENADDTPDGMILQWAADQHGGQAKGLFYILGPTLPLISYDY